jgi:hypothetical protein
MSTGWPRIDFAAVTALRRQPQSWNEHAFLDVFVLPLAG